MGIYCTKVAGQTLDSSERHCRICLLRSSRFWHTALIVILITLREKNFEHTEFGEDIDYNEKEKMREN